MTLLHRLIGSITFLFGSDRDIVKLCKDVTDKYEPTKIEETDHKETEKHEKEPFTDDEISAFCASDDLSSSYIITNNFPIEYKTPKYLYVFVINRTSYHNFIGYNYDYDNYIISKGKTLLPNDVVFTDISKPNTILFDKDMKFKLDYYDLDMAILSSTAHIHTTKEIDIKTIRINDVPNDKYKVVENNAITISKEFLINKPIDVMKLAKKGVLLKDIVK